MCADITLTVETLIDLLYCTIQCYSSQNKPQWNHYRREFIHATNSHKNNHSIQRSKRDSYIEIDSDAFGLEALNTAKLFVKLYPA